MLWKKVENRVFGEYFSNVITKEVLKEPGKGVLTIDLALKLSNLFVKYIIS